MAPVMGRRNTRDDDDAAWYQRWSQCGTSDESGASFKANFKVSFKNVEVSSKASFKKF